MGSDISRYLHSQNSRAMFSSSSKLISLPCNRRNREVSNPQPSWVLAPLRPRDRPQRCRCRGRKGAIGVPAGVSAGLNPRNIGNRWVFTTFLPGRSRESDMAWTCKTILHYLTLHFCLGRATLVEAINTRASPMRTDLS